MNQRIRVLLLIDSMDSSTGGPPGSTLGLARALVKAGMSVSILTMSDATRLRGTKTQYIDGVEVKELAALRIKGRAISLPYAREVFREAKNADVIQVHGFYLWHVIVGALASKRSRCKTSVLPHGVFERYQRVMSTKPKAIFDAVIGKRFLNNLTCAVVASEAEAESVADLIPKEKIHAIGYGIDVLQIAPRTRTHKPVRLLSLSRIAHKKRIDVAIEAVRHLLDNDFETHLDIAGTGPVDLEKELRTLVNELELNDHVTFIGHVDSEQKALALNSNDIFLLPSENENFSMATAEALSFGLPCIITREVALAEVVEKGAGVVIPVPDSKELADAIRQASSPENYAAMSAVALRAAKDDLSWAAVAGRWKEATLGSKNV